MQEVVKGYDKAMMTRFASSEQVEHQEQQIKIIKKIVDETVSRESKFPLTVTFLLVLEQFRTDLSDSL